MSHTKNVVHIFCLWREKTQSWRENTPKWRVFPVSWRVNFTSSPSGQRVSEEEICFIRKRPLISETDNNKTAKGMMGVFPHTNWYWGKFQVLVVPLGGSAIENLTPNTIYIAQRDWTWKLPVKWREKPVIWACFPVKTGFFPVTNKCPVPLGL